MDEIVRAAMAYAGAEESRRDLEALAALYLSKNASQLESGQVRMELTRLYTQQAEERVVAELAYRRLVKLIADFNS